MQMLMLVVLAGRRRKCTIARPAAAQVRNLWCMLVATVVERNKIRVALGIHRCEAQSHGLVALNIPLAVVVVAVAAGKVKLRVFTRGLQVRGRCRTRGISASLV